MEPQRSRIAQSLALFALCLTAFHASDASATSTEQWKLCESGYPAAKKIAACSKIADNAGESKADRVKALMQRAWAHHYNNDDEAAYADGTAAIKLDPDNDESYATRARMLDGNTDRAIADYSAAIRLKPFAYYYASRGELYRRKGDPAHSAEDYRSAVKIDTADLESGKSNYWGYEFRSVAYRELGETDKALADLEEFNKRKKPADTFPIIDRGDLYLRKRDFDHAIADYTEIITKEPDSSEGYARRALAYRLKGDYQHAILDYDTMVKSDDSVAEIFIGRGLAYAGLGEPERAVLDFTRAIDIFGEDPAPFYDRAQSQREAGNYEAAIADYTAAIERKPGYAVAFNSRGRTYQGLKDSSRALADFNEAIRFDGKFAAAYCNRARLLFETGRTGEAFADFTSAIGADPTNKDFLIARADAYARQQQYADAERDFDGALKLDPVSAVAYAGRAGARLKLGTTDRALDDANRAILIDKNFAQAHTIRADIYAAAGRTPDAQSERAFGDALAAQQDKARRAAEETRRHPRVKISLNGTYPIIPPYLKRNFTVNSTIEVRDDQIVYKPPSLGPYKLLSGEQIQETFNGICNHKKATDTGTRTVTARVDKTLVTVELHSRVDFTVGACRGRFEDYKEEFLIDFAKGGCKFSYMQERSSLDNTGADQKIADQKCTVESLR